MEKLRNVKSTCCGDAVMKCYNERRPGYEEEFYCRCCGKELNIINVQDVMET